MRKSDSDATMIFFYGRLGICTEAPTDLTTRVATLRVDRHIFANEASVSQCKRVATWSTKGLEL